MFLSIDVVATMVVVGRVTIEPICTMEIAQIPRLEYWQNENEIFRSLDHLSEMCDRLCRGRQLSGRSAAPVVVLRQMIEENKLPISEIRELYFLLRSACFAYRPPLAKVTEGLTTMFPSSKLGRWEKQKLRLKRLIRTHSDIINGMMDVQTRCWKSRDALKLHASMLEAAEVTLPYYVDDGRQYRARKYALKMLKKKLPGKQKHHASNVDQYLTCLGEEAGTRNDIMLISKSLAEDVSSCLQRQLARLWDKLQKATDPELFNESLDVSETSTAIYNATTKLYYMTIPPCDVYSPEFNEKISRGRLEDSIYTQLDTDEHTTYGAAYDLTGTVTQTQGEVPNYFLKPRLGDEVRIKMLSPDSSVGFGYIKPSIFSLKKWGMFYTHILRFQFEHDSENGE